MFTWINSNFLKNHLSSFCLFLYLYILSCGIYFSVLDSLIVKIIIIIIILFVKIISNYRRYKLLNDFLVINFFFRQNNYYIVNNYVQFYFKFLSKILIDFLNLILTKKKNITWKPLFKKNSYLLWFRSNRNIWSNLRSEENNNSKNV